MAVVFGACVSILASAAAAQGQIALTRAAYVERVSDNGATRSIAPATNLRKGDTVILVVAWRSDKDRANFTVSSPIPGHLAYQGSSTDGQIVSVDGGRNWGRLDSMTIAQPGGTRRASVEDVTHLRWQIGPRQSVQGTGKITYSAIVR